MASRSLMPSTSMRNHVTYSGDTPPKSHSFGQVCLPKKTTTAGSPSTRQSVVTSSIATAMSAKLCKTSSAAAAAACLAKLWKEVQGCNDWDDLVEPLHPLLRQEIIRYGEFVAACYHAFDLDPSSKRYLTCKYGKTNMLREVGMEDSGYQVTKYIYATPDISIPIQNGSPCARWIGYVAVSSDDEVRRLGRRDILVTFRGTVTNNEWIANFMSSLTPARLDPNDPRPDVKVESGFLSLYTSDESEKFGLKSCRDQLLSEVSRLLNKYRGEEISISLAGHSMGSSLALLLAYDIAELGLNRLNPSRDVTVTAFSFGGPRVGNTGFKQRCEELGVKVLRIVNVNDPITKLPGVFLNENFRVFGHERQWSCSCYTHVGIEIALDFFNMQNPSCVHDIETYISMLRCPRMLQIQKDGGGYGGGVVDFLDKAKNLLLCAQNSSPVPLRNAASRMLNLFQCQSFEFLMDENILGCMNSLAFCMFL